MGSSLTPHQRGAAHTTTCGAYAPRQRLHPQSWMRGSQRAPERLKAAGGGFHDSGGSGGNQSIAQSRHDGTMSGFRAWGGRITDQQQDITVCSVCIRQSKTPWPWRTRPPPYHSAPRSPHDAALKQRGLLELRALGSKPAYPAKAASAGIWPVRSVG